MKCLSLWQPWASLLVAGLKRVETRSWPIKHRGPLLIHAAKRWEPDQGEIAVLRPFRAALESLGVRFTPSEADAMRAWGLPLGCVVGRVDVVECCTTGHVAKYCTTWDGPPEFVKDSLYRYLHISETERAFGDYSGGRFAFLCENAFRLPTPIPFRGAQGLFDVPDAVLEDGCKRRSAAAPADLFSEVR